MKKKLIWSFLLIMIMISIYMVWSNYSIKDTEKFQIEIILKGKDTDYWKSVATGAKGFRGEIPLSINISGPDKEEEHNLQASYIKKAIERQPDAILLAAGNNQDVDEMVKKVVNTDIPVILIDSPIEESGWSSFVGSNNIEIGEKLATQIFQKSKEKTIVGVINFVKEAPAAMYREESFYKEIELLGGIVAKVAYCDSDSKKAEKLARDMLIENKEINALVGLNAQSTIGAVKAVENLNIKNIYIGGVDCTLEQADMIDRGSLDFSIVQNPYLIGYLGVEQAYKLLLGDQIESEIIVESKIIDKQNIYEKGNQQLIFPF